MGWGAAGVAGPHGRTTAKKLEWGGAAGPGGHTTTKKTQEGHGQYTASALVAAGRRLTSLDLVAFVLLFRELMMHLVAPWTKVIQSSALEPWALHRAYQKHTDATRGALTVLKFGRSLLRICVLLQQHCAQADVKALLIACLYATPGKLFPESTRSEHGAGTAFGRLLPGFLLALPGFLRADGPKFRKVGLMAPTLVAGE